MTDIYALAALWPGLVLGHRGKSFFARGLIGSVSKQVMHYAHCTTTAVR